MGARWYDSKLTMWTSADTIVSSLSNPQNLNRYTYVKNSPLLYTDPSGHCEQSDTACWVYMQMMNQSMEFAGVVHINGYLGDHKWQSGVATWTANEARGLWEALVAVSKAVHKIGANLYDVLGPIYFHKGVWDQLDHTVSPGELMYTPPPWKFHEFCPAGWRAILLTTELTGSESYEEMAALFVHEIGHVVSMRLLDDYATGDMPVWINQVKRGATEWKEAWAVSGYRKGYGPEQFAEAFSLWVVQATDPSHTGAVWKGRQSLFGPFTCNGYWQNKHIAVMTSYIRRIASLGQHWLP